MGAFLLQDWLALHRIDAERLRQALRADAAFAVGNDAWKAPDPDFARAVDAAQVAARLVRALPPLADLVGRVLGEVRFDLAPDRQRFPRAFTLDDDGSGRVLVSCPLSGRVSDLLSLAHEMGHACQSLACATPPPPVLRETAAYLAEQLLARAALQDGDPAAQALAGQLAARQARIGRDAMQLLQVLDQPSAPYSYRWNYAPAWLVAKRACDQAGPERLAQLVTAPDTLADLLMEFGLLGKGG